MGKKLPVSVHDTDQPFASMRVAVGRILESLFPIIKTPSFPSCGQQDEGISPCPGQR